ncbi:uncharacterized protein LOC104888900 [Beta vulgaris subsp. vulgaris]|uniref:uncharacterized protein LOC104888900 n=1 Tax=Beta vulgaris subsp. vulgaris TaxID=3555 RepID=UPI00053F3844|nr:uncharacterized protein LOC104888900 [Beta vulgaris subsp. vulgaris]
MRAIKKRWSQTNKGVTLWVAQIAVAEGMLVSGEVINDIEMKAHDLDRQKKDNAFEFYHCWVAMHELPRWMSGKDSTVVTLIISSFQRLESVRKDVKRAFGVLQSRFAIVQRPNLAWDEHLLWEIMLACIIFHNMIVKDERDTYQNYGDMSEFEKAK